ncbi:hypothetical protein ANTPLA_LOCUS5018 [Anthophora plagiata]
MRELFAILISILAISTVAEAATMQGLAKALNISMKDFGECLDEIHLSDGDTTKLESVLSQGKISKEEPKEFLNEFGCFIACAFEKANIMKNKEIQLTQLIQTAERMNIHVNDEVKQKLIDCINKAKEQEEKCQIGLEFTTCFTQNVLRH